MRYDGQTDWEILNKLPVRIVLMLFRSRNQIWEQDHKIVHEFGLTWAQFGTLAALRQTQPHRMTPTQLYDAVQVTSGGLTKILYGLEELGYIIRVDNPIDRRSKFAQLTDQGRGLIEKIANQLFRANNGLFNQTLSEQEQEQFAVLLEKICVGLEDK